MISFTKIEKESHHEILQEIILNLLLEDYVFCYRITADKPYGKSYTVEMLGKFGKRAVQLHQRSYGHEKVLAVTQIRSRKTVWFGSDRPAQQPKAGVTLRLMFMTLNAWIFAHSRQGWTFGLQRSLMRATHHGLDGCGFG